MIEAPEPQHHHHHKTGLPWFDVLIPVAIVCISIAALLTSRQSEKSMHALVEENRRLVSAQSTPLLMLDTSNLHDNKPAISMTISNVGTGPAQIAWFRLTDDQGIDYSGGALYERVEKLDPGAFFTSPYISGTLLHSGDERLVFRWPQPVVSKPALAEWDKLNETRKHLHASACYCSIFYECSITKFGGGRPTPVASCEQTVDRHTS